MGNVKERIYPDGSKITQDYDLSGRLTNFTNKRQQSIVYEYDSQGKVYGAEGKVRKNVKVAPKTSSFNAYKGFFTFLRTVTAFLIKK